MTERNFTLIRGGQYHEPPPFRPPLRVFAKLTTAPMPQRDFTVVERPEKKAKTS